jgi:hypothetical protein
MLEIIMSLADIVMGPFSGRADEGEWFAADAGPDRAGMRSGMATGGSNVRRGGEREVSWKADGQRELAPHDTAQTSSVRTRATRVVAEEASGGEDGESDDERMRRVGVGRHVAQRAKARRATARGNATLAGMMSDEVLATLAQLQQRQLHRADKTNTPPLREGWGAAASPLQTHVYSAGATTVTQSRGMKVTVPRRGSGRLRLPGYMRPTSSSINSAAYVNSLTQWGAGSVPTPRLARPRADTGPPMLKGWTPPLTQLLLRNRQERGRSMSEEGDVTMFEDDHGWVLVDAEDGGGREGGGWGGLGVVGGGGEFTPAAELKREKAKLQRSKHERRREVLHHKQQHQQLVRLHEGAWLQVIRNTEHGTRNTELGTRNTEHGTRNTEQ